MILDKSLQFDSGAAITVTAPSANTIDLSQSRDIGVGSDPALAVVCTVVTAFTAAGAATLQVQFQTSPDDATWTNLVMSDAIPVASLAAGTEVLRCDVPLGCQRYLRLNYVVATGPMTAGAVTSQIVIDREANVTYPSGFNAAN
jgi:hypothetical protein